MFYASLKAAHLLATIAWVGGMFFMLAVLRPAAAAVLEGPPRARLVHAALGRFLDVAVVSAIVALMSGAAMFAFAWRSAYGAGLAFNVPLDWYVMIGGFLFMIAIVAHIRLRLYRRLSRAVAAEAWADAARLYASIRTETLLSLAIGVFIVVTVRLGAAA